ncbi:MAG: hypothetical protein MI702_00070 [Chlorobiales bacterium]|nr:hypothetical protein [Chlorobiales bacterium]
MNSLLEKMTNSAKAATPVKIIAVGGCGLSILDGLNSLADIQFHSVSIDTDSARLAETSSDDRLLLGEMLTEGYGTGGDENLGQRSLSGMHVEIRELLADSKVNIIVGGLGGGTASALLPELSKISRSLGVLTLIVGTRPFKYEGASKTIAAKRKMHSLFRSADSVFMINNDALVGEKTKLSASEAVKRSDASVIETITGILEFISSDKRMLLDFGTIKGQLTRGGLSAFASGVSAMRNNAIEALKAALDQFAHYKSDITKAPRALIQFSIDDDVLMDGVKNAFGVAQRIFSKDAQLAMGVIFNSTRQGKTRVSIIASGLPLFNEVVDANLAMEGTDIFEENSRPVRATSLGNFHSSRQFLRAGESRKPFLNSKKVFSADLENVKILNPHRLNDDELKIPAYLRRRMLSEH